MQKEGMLTVLTRCTSVNKCGKLYHFVSYVEARTDDNIGPIEPRQRLFVRIFNELFNDVKKVSKVYL